MKAKEFWDKFQEIFKDGADTKKEAVSVWENKKGQFTNFIKRQIELILENDGLETSREYYRIDLTGWKQLTVEKKLIYDFENHLWDLEVAVEHENSSVSWMDEVVKLLHINCPLRIVIGYLPIEQTNNHQAYLDKMLSQILKTKAVGNCSLKNGEFMIIIGDSKCKDIIKRCNYKAYVFDLRLKRFVPL